MKRKLIKFIASVVLCASLLSGCGYKLVNEYEEPAIGVIVEKEYEHSYTTTNLIPISNGKVTTFIPNITYYPEKHYVTIKVNDFSETFDDEYLFSQYEINDTITVSVHHKEYKCNRKMKYYRRITYNHQENIHV